jgi:hypothetical protein|tara:strand:- start:6318 stop:6899 length:582 start_codon:yes stop_codon:yes gene_type:complete
MALPSSGSISLNQMHVEVNGSSGSNVSINDTDIRGLIGKGSGSNMSFNEWYGASANAGTATMSAGSYVVPGDKFASASYGYSSWSAGGFYPIGSATDVTMTGTNGTDHTVLYVMESYSTIVTSGQFATRGNFNNQTFQSVFGYTKIKWGGTTIMSNGNISTGTYYSSNGGRTTWFLNLDARPTGNNKTVEFSN